MAIVEALQINHVTDNSGHKVAGVDATVQSIDMKPDESVQVVDNTSTHWTASGGFMASVHTSLH